MDFFIGISIFFGIIYAINLVSTIERDKKMKQAQYEANKAHRQAQNRFEMVLVALEELYGSETGAPFVDTVIDHEEQTVRLNGLVVNNRTDIRTVVKEAEAAIAELMPSFPRIEELSVTLVGAFVGEVKLADLTVPTVIDGKPLDDVTDEAIMAIEDDVFLNIKKYLPHIKSGSTLYHAYEYLADVRIPYMEQALRDFKHNYDAKVTEEATGVYQERVHNDYPWSGVRELKVELEQTFKITPLMLKEAIKKGYNWKPFSVGSTLSIDIGAINTKTSHPQRVAALRLGVLIDNPLVFTVDEDQGDRHYKITSATGLECVAVLNTDENTCKPFIATLKPLNHLDYFEKNGLMDEVYQNDLDASLEELMALKLWDF